jgi:fructose-bisphosphate aldolase class II
MLVTLKEILCLAEARNIAVGSFNTPNLESIMAVIDAAEELDVPVIIMHAEVHESIMPISIIGPIMIERARAAKVPVCVHLDHGENLEYVNKALSLGFTSVMYDGSALEYSINVANTKIVVGMAKRVGASVEAEIGTLGKRELGYKTESNEPEPEQVYTNPDDAKRFVESTGIDALACSFGTAHGLYLKKPKLDFTVLDKVRANVDLPIVMHGGSGVSDEDYCIVISKGVRKINYYTYMAKAGGEKIKEKFDLKMFPLAYQGTNYHCYYSVVAEEKDAPVYYHDIVEWGYLAMKNNVRKALTVFANK